jgi:NAD-dependent SIR2 family protein deacetylase
MTLIPGNVPASDLLRFARDHPRMLVLGGAGISTGSGIPDYRDEQGQWKRRQPVMAQEFMRSASVRRRYWARSMLGWPMIAGARPNAAHDALARMEQAGCITLLVTQNVDGLHQRAGSRRVVELHGSLAGVACVACRTELPRPFLQETLESLNPKFLQLRAATAPDGDADLDGRFDTFAVPDCPQCGGVLKPTVVFFGDAVPKDRVHATLAALEEADAMLVVGSSLMTYSGYRFCEKARQLGKPIAAINLGCTRADHLFALKVQRSCAEVLEELAAGLVPETASRAVALTR